MLLSTYYAVEYLLCSKLCWHNLSRPNRGPILAMPKLDRGSSFGSEKGGSTSTGPTAPHDSVIQGECNDYRMRGLYQEEFLYSKFEKRMCNN